MESYDHITLTDDEITEAMIWAKRKKEELIKIERVRRIEEFNRKKASEQWNFDIIKTFMINRASQLYGDQFVVDENNEMFFNLMCYYFTKDPLFEEMAEKYGVKNPSIEKGLLVVGNFGSGKTWLMRIFQKNKRQTFWIRTAKQISNDYLTSKDKLIPELYLEPFKNPSNDSSVFYQDISGLCIDDLGAEGEKNNFGNTINVIGDLIEQRYQKKYCGELLHGTTNLSAEEIRKFYGERVVSRMREIFNFIKLGGNDRRK